MSGLLTAKALAPFHSTVTMVERDDLPSTGGIRRGVPHGEHLHILTPRGSQLFEQLCPGILDELVAEGVPTWLDGDLSKLRMSVGRHEIVRSGQLRGPNACAQYYASRPLLEETLRQRVFALPNIRIVENTHMADVVLRDYRIAGIRITDRTSGRKSTLEADLVVDATGHRSRTPAVLDALGYGRPPVEEAPAGLAYTTQRLQLAANDSPAQFVTYPEVPSRSGGFALIAIEGGEVLLTVFSTAGIEIPKDYEQMLEFIGAFAPADIVATVGAATPLGQAAHYHLSTNRWHRYDKMRKLPEGLLVVGDAVCRMNPLQANGMTVAALEATELQHCLRRGSAPLTRRFFRATARRINPLWQAVTQPDVALPQAVGGRAYRNRPLGRSYMRRLMSAAETDPYVAEHFLRVVGMVDSPARLFHPTLICRLIAARR